MARLQFNAVSRSAVRCHLPLDTRQAGGDWTVVIDPALVERHAVLGGVSWCPQPARRERLQVPSDDGGHRRGAAGRGVVGLAAG